MSGTGQTHPTILYALFRNGVQIGKAHSTVWAVRTEAIQLNLVTQSGPRQFWPDSYDVREACHA